MTQAAETGGILPRRAALRLVQGVIADRRVMSDQTAVLEPLAPAERARAQRLALDALRGAGRADRILAPCFDRRPPLRVVNILRLAVAELAQGAAAHGVVNDWVAIAAEDRKHAAMKGLVNAVLRRIAPDAAAQWAALPPPRLPDWLRKPLVAAWGRDAVAGIEGAQAAAPPIDLTARGDPSALAAATGGRLLPTGSVRIAPGAQVSALPGYDTGAFWVQDAAAALPARVLRPMPGERILDLCAAPGGKTLQLAAAGADVTALDLSPQRLARVEENLTRTGLSARIVAGDALAFAEGGWDAILLDAPCSATGTIRRHPDLPFARDGSGVAALAATQAAMIDHALGLLRPGGRLVFCTCSLLPQEGERQVTAALARHPGLAVDREALAVPGVDPAWIGPAGGLRLRPDLWPDLGGLDGFHIALFRKGA